MAALAPAAAVAGSEGETRRATQPDMEIIVGRFAAFENAALKARLKRLTRSEASLQERIQSRIAQVEAQGRWAPSDPICQRLNSVLKQVRKDLLETEREHERRMRAAPRGRRLAPA